MRNKKHKTGSGHLLASQLTVAFPLRKRRPAMPYAIGFTLVEVAVVLIIAGILLAAGLRLISARAERAQIDVTRSHQEAIKSALIAYLGKTRRLPCPDTNLDGSEERGGGPIAPCTAYVGTVPYLDLGLDQASVLDGWENYIRYVVSPPQPTLPALPVATPPWTTNWMYTFVAGGTATTTQTPTAPSAFWPTTSMGAILVNDVNGNAIANPASTPPAGAVIVLISHGRNGMGAINIKGAQNDSTSAGADETKNISPVVVGPPAQIVVYDREITLQDVPAHGPFDDLLMVIRRDDLIVPLTTNGTFKGSTDVALSQANDIVIGLIVATRTNAAVVNGNYKYLLPTSVPFTGPLADLGVTYTLTYPTPSPPAPTPPEVDNLYPPSGQASYTLTSADGKSKLVTIDEIRGILTQRAGGFF